MIDFFLVRSDQPELAARINKEIEARHIKSSQIINIETVNDFYVKIWFFVRKERETKKSNKTFVFSVSRRNENVKV